MKALQPFLLHGSAGQAEVPQQEFWASTERRPWGEGKCLPRLGGGTLKNPPPTPAQAKPWLGKPITPVLPVVKAAWLFCNQILA